MFKIQIVGNREWFDMAWFYDTEESRVVNICQVLEYQEGLVCRLVRI